MKLVIAVALMIVVALSVHSQGVVGVLPSSSDLGMGATIYLH